MILIAFLLGWSAAALSQTSWGPSRCAAGSAHAYTIDEILDAIRAVETGGEPGGGREARGDGGRALGPYQIHRAHWVDSGMPGRYEDCRDPLYARREVLAYFQRWCPKELACRDAETLARVHNGGPNGRSKASTLPYWKKTKLKLEEARAKAHSAARGTWHHALTKETPASSLLSSTHCQSPQARKFAGADCD